MKFWHLFFLGVLLSLTIKFHSPISAQDIPEPDPASIIASDDLALMGDYYTPSSITEYPAVILLHMANGRRSDWNPLIPALLERDIAVLNVDLRGHGATGGSRNWQLADEDVQTIIAWLREQPGVTKIALAGASVGSNLAIRGAAQDESVVGAIALSPGLDYFGVTTEDAVELLDRRPLMLIVAKSDSYSASSVLTLLDTANGDTTVRIYRGGRHGTSLLSEAPLVEMLVDWLAEHFAAE